MRTLDRPPLQGDGQDLWDQWYDVLLLNVNRTQEYLPTLNPASVAANSENTETFTVEGLTINDVVVVNKPTKTAGLSILDAVVTATDTISITFRNFTGAPIDPGAAIYRIIATRL